jgi:hypothetical protein
VTATQYRIPNYGADRFGYEFDVANMVTLFESDSFEAIPEGWCQDQAREGSWFAEDGNLIGEAPGNTGPTVLWFDQPIQGNHALSFRVTITKADNPKGAEGGIQSPLPGEILAYWNGDGRTSGDNPWSLILGALDGWPGGYSGTEYLSSVGGLDYVGEGTVIGNAFDLRKVKTFDVFAGRYNEVDFLFGSAVDAGTGQATPPALVAQAILAASGMTPPACHRTSPNYVAIGTSAFANSGCRVSLQRLAVYQIPDAAVSNWSGDS